MKHSLEWWLEPFLIVLGNVIHGFHTWRHDRLFDKFLDGFINHDQFIRMSYWGMTDEQTRTLIEDREEYFKDMYTYNGHTNTDIRNWYIESYTISLAFKHFLKRFT